MYNNAQMCPFWASEEAKGTWNDQRKAYLAKQQKEPCLHRGLWVIAELDGIGHNKLSKVNKALMRLMQLSRRMHPCELHSKLNWPRVSNETSFYWIICKCYSTEVDRIKPPTCLIKMDQNQCNLQTHWSKPLDMQRVQALNPEAVKHWFNIVEKLVVNTGIKKEDMKVDSHLLTRENPKWLVQEASKPSISKVVQIRRMW